MKELNNLIMLSRDFDGKEDLLKKLKYDLMMLLDPGLIRAYVAENGTLTACSVDKYGMEMPNFDSTIDDINHAEQTRSHRGFSRPRESEFQKLNDQLEQVLRADRLRALHLEPREPYASATCEHVSD